MLDKKQTDAIEMIRKFEIDARHVELDKFDEIMYLSNAIRKFNSFIQNEIEVTDGSLHFINIQIEDCIEMIDNIPYHKDEKKRLKLHNELLQKIRTELGRAFISLSGGIINGSYVFKDVR